MAPKKPRGAYPSAKAQLDQALRSRPLLPHEVGAGALAKRLAYELDNATDVEDVTRLSRQLLAALRSLGMTRDRVPAGAGGKVGDDEPIRAEPRSIDRFRARRARLRAAPDSDIPPT